MKKLLLFTLMISAFNLLTTAQSQEKNKLSIVVSTPYIRETIPGTQISSAYMSLKNNSNQNRKLIAVSSDISPRIEMHTHLITDSMMKMRQLDAITIPAHQQIKLQPYGQHLMLFDLKKSLNAAQIVQMRLHFDNKSTMIVQVPVISLKTQAASLGAKK